MPTEELIARTGNIEYKIEIDKDNKSRIVINGQNTSIEAVELHGDIFSIIIDGKSYLFNISANGDSYNIGWSGGSVDFEIEDDRSWLMRKLTAGKVGGKLRKKIRAPMPGLVVKIMVEIGAGVKKSDPLLVVEAMKMENEISSPSNGKVAEVLVKAGQPVEKDEVMITLEG